MSVLHSGANTSTKNNQSVMKDSLFLQKVCHAFLADLADTLTLNSNLSLFRPNDVACSALLTDV